MENTNETLPCPYCKTSKYVTHNTHGLNDQCWKCGAYIRKPFLREQILMKKLDDKISKKANELVNVFWFNTQLSAKHCALIHCRRIIEELNHHSDLHGYYQDEDGYQSIIERIEFYKKVMDQIEERW